ncbi:MAG: hypothetical protein GC162_20655 [Planctomycetes bacterium]|nr:hypothetical protein [Planctomycetota bacterium]
MISNVSLRNVVAPWHWLLGLGAAIWISIAPGSAQAVLISNDNGNPMAAQYFHLQAYAEIKEPAGNILNEAGRTGSSSGNLPIASESGTISASGSSLSYSAFAALDAFGHARVAATASITNSVANFGYNVVASRGSRTQAFFSSAQTPGRVVFNFTVTGTESSPFGLALGRVDFLARAFTPGSGSFFDVFGSDALHAVGAGTYSFTYTGSTASPLDILFYAAAGVITQDAGVPGSTNFTGFANFANTFNLTSIDVFDTDDQPIDEWTLMDAATNAAVFNQDGRISAIPEPATLALLVPIAAAFFRRR